jgi:carbon starvation protein CstA
LPLVQWSIGTFFLLLIAYIFARYTNRIAKHHALYSAQLVSMTPTYSGIAESIPVEGSLHRMPYLYYAFPLFDLAMWSFFCMGELIGGRFDMIW